MDLHQLSTKQLQGTVRTLEHAKANRQGGLLVTEQKALDNVRAELERRADIEYCRTHDR